MASPSCRVIVYGGRGALGSTLVAYMRSKNIWVVSIDLFANQDANANVIVDPALPWTGQNENVCEKMEEVLGGEKVDAIFCVAGGWAGGNAASKDLVKNADLMVKQSVWTSVISASLASKCLKEGGLLTLTGAQPALEATPGMMGYGLAKAAVHQFVHSLAAPKSGMPPNSSVAAILPVTLDTPMNRKFMPKADHSAWTPLEFVAELFHEWMQGTNRPGNGELIQLVTKDGKTELIKA